MTTPDTTPPSLPVFKVVLVGAAGAGKTALLEKYLYGRTRQSHTPTPGLDFHTATTNIDQEKVKVIFWEIASSKMAHDLSRAYFSGAYVVLGVIDMRDPAQIPLIEKFRYDLVHASTHNARLMLVGTHADMSSPKGIKESDLKALAKRWQCDAFCVNINDDAAVKELFKQINNALSLKHTESPESKKTQLAVLRKTVVEPPKPKLVPMKAAAAKPRSFGFMLPGLVLALSLVLGVTALQCWPLLSVQLIGVIAMPEKIAVLLLPFLVAVFGFTVGACLHLSAAFIKQIFAKKPIATAPVKKTTEKKNTKTIQFRLRDGSILKREKIMQPKDLWEYGSENEGGDKEIANPQPSATEIFVPLNPFHPH